MNNTSETNNQNPKRKSYWIAGIMALLVLGMFGFGYAMVPIYNVLCKKLGLNGSIGNKAVAASVPAVMDKTRIITVQFMTTNNANIPWKFYPLQKVVKVHPGENKRIAFFAQNDSSQTMTVQAIPSITPGNAAKYLKKTECFCFNRQTLKSKESILMPVLFHLDTDLPKNIKTVTLSYTLFDVTNMKAKANPQAGKLSS